MSWVLGPTKMYTKRKIQKSTLGRQRRVQELRHQQEKQTVKKGSGLQQEYPALESSSQRKTPLPPHH